MSLKNYINIILYVINKMFSWIYTIFMSVIYLCHIYVLRFLKMKLINNKIGNKNKTIFNKVIMLFLVFWLIGGIITIVGEIVYRNYNSDNN